MTFRAALLGALAAPVALAQDSAAVTLTNIVMQPRPIPSAFVGMSFEISNAPILLSFNSTPRMSYVNALRTLGCGSSKGVNVRIGGNSADESAYLPSGPLPFNDTYRITASDLRAYAAAVPLWNGDMVIDTTLQNATDPSLAVAHIQAVSEIIGWSRVAGVEVGNEVDVFYQHGIRPANYTYAEYQAEFAMYLDALTARTNISMPHIEGGTFCCGTFDGNITTYIDTFAASLSSFSYHHYPLGHCNGHVQTLESMMSDKASYSFAAEQLPYVTHSLSKGVPYVISEGNSISCGGQYGISDVFASALWAIDSLFSVASIGISRWNFHGGVTGPYSPIWYNSSSEDIPDVRPLFYGMWAFSNVTANGAVIHNTSVVTTNNLIKAWYVVDSAGAATCVVIHKDPFATQSASVTITPAAPLTQAATLLRVQASSLGINATHGISFAGLTFDGSQDGLPLGTPVSESVPSGSKGFQFNMPPASIAILKLPRA